MNPRTIISEQTTRITRYVKDLFKFGDTHYKTLQHLLPPTPPQTRIFYLLPKIHKPGNPGRPIIPGCDSPTDRLSSFIDHHLKPFCSSLPSYIKDRNHFLQTIFNIATPLPRNTIISTIDVKSLYTNIPHNEGIKAVLETLDRKYGRMWPLRTAIHQFLEYILKENYPTFKTNFTYKNMVLQWAPKWHPHLQTYSWVHLSSHCFHPHLTNSYLSCGRDL